jgi:hypothetical protein
MFFSPLRAHRLMLCVKPPSSRTLTIYESGIMAVRVCQSAFHLSLALLEKGHQR